VYIDAEFSIKSWQIEFNNTSKRSLNYIQVSFTPEMQGWFNISNSINVNTASTKHMVKDHMTISIDEGSL
jgi:hypothetical protein